MALTPLLIVLAQDPVLLGPEPIECVVTAEDPVVILEEHFKDYPENGVVEMNGRSREWKHPLNLMDQRELWLHPYGLPHPKDSARVHSLPFRVPRSGKWSLRLGTSFFDAALVVKDAEGTILGIDDDGWFWLNPLLEDIQLRKGKDYVLEVLAVGEGMGSSTLSVTRGQYDWIGEAETLLELDTSGASLVKTQDGGNIEKRDGSTTSAQAWVRKKLNAQNVQNRIADLDALRDSSDVSIAKSCLSLGRNLSLRHVADHHLAGKFRGRTPEYPEFWEETRTAFSTGTELLARCENIGKEERNTLFAENFLMFMSPRMHLRMALGDFEGAADETAFAIRTLKEEGWDPATWGLLYAELGYLKIRSGHPARALRWLREGVRVGDPATNSHHIALARFHLAEALEILGKDDEAREQYENTIKDELWARELITGDPKRALADWFERATGISPLAPPDVASGLNLKKQISVMVAAIAKEDPKASDPEIATILLRQALSYLGGASGKLVSMYRKQGNFMGARIQLAEFLACNRLLVEGIGGPGFLNSAYSEENSLNRPDQVFADAITVTQKLNDPMTTAVLALTVLSSQAFQLPPEKPGWLAWHELMVQCGEVLLDGNNDAEFWTRLSHTFQLSDSSHWDEIARKVSSGLEFSPLAFSIWAWERVFIDIKKQIQEETIPANHPKALRLQKLLRETCEKAGINLETNLELTEEPAKPIRPPDLVLWSPTSSTLTKRGFELSGFLDDPSGVPDIRYRLNGQQWVTLASMEEFSQQAKFRERSGEEGTWRFKVPLSIPGGANNMKLEIQAISSSGLKGEAKTFNLDLQPEARRLHVFAFGVADYEQDRLDLRYPVKDAEDLVAALSSHTEGLFTEVRVASLKDEEVSSAAIRRQLKSFLRQADEEDTVVVFGAGHGVRDADGEYYFLTSDATPTDPYAGISRHDIEKLVTWSGLRARRKVLLLDTCHSGAGSADAETRARGAEPLFPQEHVNQVIEGQGGGTYILAASSDGGAALEADGNGLFTAGILAALNGAGDSNGDGNVSVEELRSFVVGFVEEKTEGRQRPTFPLVEGGDDFPLASTN